MMEPEYTGKNPAPISPNQPDVAKLVAVDDIALQAAALEAFIENQYVAFGIKPVRLYVSRPPGDRGTQLCEYVCAAENVTASVMAAMLEYFSRYAPHVAPTPLSGAVQVSFICASFSATSEVTGEGGAGT